MPQWSGGNTWFDLCRRNNGTLTNGPTWRATARPGGWGELSFDGTNDYVAFAAPPSPFGAGVAAYTISLWYYVTSNPASTQQMFCTESSGAGNAVNVGFRGGQIGVEKFGGTAIIRTAPLSAGTPRRIIATFDGTTTTLYLDGTNSGSAAVAYNGGTYTLFNFGREIGGNQEFFAGQLDDVSIWNRALSAAEVAADFDLSRRGYPGVLNRVRRVAYSAPIPPAPQPGNLVCAEASVSARVNGTASLSARVNATVTIEPRVNATAEVLEC